MVTPAARQDAVAHLKESLEVSERRACTMIAVDRSVVRYRSRRPDEAELRCRLRELADQRRRFGYRRLHVLLRGEGWPVNRKKTQRLYREEGLERNPIRLNLGDSPEARVLIQAVCRRGGRQTCRKRSLSIFGPGCSQRLPREVS